MTATATPRWVRQLQALGACSEAVEWARGYPSLSRAWAACTRYDWMLWYAGAVAGGPHSPSRVQLVQVAVDCARLVLHKAPTGEDRPRLAIEAAVVYIRNPSPVAAAEAAWAARAAAEAAWAARAAAWAAEAAEAAWAAEAAEAAAWAARAAARAAAWAAGAADILAIVRRHYPRPPRRVKV